MDEDLTYRMFLGMVKSPLDMPALEQTSDLSAKIFGFRDHIKKCPIPLPVPLPQVGKLTVLIFY